MATTIEPLATIADLEARLEFELDDPHMQALAGAALEDASVLVLEYGVSTWTPNTAPPIAVMLTLKAAARFMNNPMGLETARAADETNMWGSGSANGVHLTSDEKDLLRAHKRNDSGFQAVRTYSFNSQLSPTQPMPPGAYWPVDGYGAGSAKYFPDYQPGQQYYPYYPGG